MLDLKAFYSPMLFKIRYLNGCLLITPIKMLAAGKKTPKRVYLCKVSFSGQMLNHSSTGC